jgi:hypothetical protein
MLGSLSTGEQSQRPCGDSCTVDGVGVGVGVV